MVGGGGCTRARHLFGGHIGGSPDGVWAAPGRVNIIGEHTDYNNGFCLPIALPHRTYVAARRRDDDKVILVSQLDDSVLTWEGTLDEIAPGSVAGWKAYTGGVAWALRQAGHGLGGFEAALVTCVPLGAGLSSSAAVECGVGLALADLYDLDLTDSDSGRIELVNTARAAENEVAEAPTGGLDQTASLRTTEGHALLIDCDDWSVRQVPFNLDTADLELLVIDTCAPHRLVDGQYEHDGGPARMPHASSELVACVTSVTWGPPWPPLMTKGWLAASATSSLRTTALPSSLSSSMPAKSAKWGRS